MKQLAFKKFIPGIAWFFIIMVLICLPGKDVPDIEWLTSINFDKVIHAGIFGMLDVLLCWPFYRSSFNKGERLSIFIKIAIAVCFWGIITEFIQKFFIPGRTFDLMDWAADSLGALLGLVFCSKFFSKPNSNKTVQGSDTTKA